MRAPKVLNSQHMINKFKWLVLLIFIYSILFLNYEETKHILRPLYAPQPKKTIAKDVLMQTIILFVGILSKSSAFKRRDAIRKTWMKSCEELDGVSCVFFTDTIPGGQNLTGKDVVQLPVPPGMHFGQRLLEMFKWAIANVELDYFLRVDDDYFLCMDHLFYDVMHRPRNGLYWGFVHCQPNIVRIDEGWVILSVDLIREVLGKRNTTLLCHPYGGQALALWIRDSRLDITYLYDNKRIIHTQADRNPGKFFKGDVCDRVLGIHGLSPEKIINYWNITKSNRNKNTRREVDRVYSVPELQPPSNQCPLPNKFDWRHFGTRFRFEPKLCHLNPTWMTPNVEYRGRVRD